MRCVLQEDHVKEKKEETIVSGTDDEMKARKRGQSEGEERKQEKKRKSHKTQKEGRVMEEVSRFRQIIPQTR